MATPVSTPTAKAKVIWQSRLVPLLKMVSSIYSNEKASKEDLHAMLFDRFHGEGENISHAELFLNNASPYKGLLQADTDLTGLDNQTRVNCIIPKYRHQGCDTVTVRVSLKLAHLMSSTTSRLGKKATGVYLWTQAEKSLWSIKKAIAFMPRVFLNSDGSKSSGQDKADLMKAVNARMWDWQCTGTKTTRDFDAAGTCVIVQHNKDSADTANG